jgi:hypothetical protein
MTDVATRCANCQAPIVDPTTQVVHGPLSFCCPNCSASMEEQATARSRPRRAGGQGGAPGGSDPQAPEHKNDLRCSRCQSPIVHDLTIEMRGDELFCCRNCMEAAQAD